MKFNFNFLIFFNLQFKMINDLQIKIKIKFLNKLDQFKI